MADTEQDPGGDEAAERAGGTQHPPAEGRAGGTVEVHATLPPCPDAEDVSAESAPALRPVEVPDRPDEAAPASAAAIEQEVAAEHQRAE